MLDGDKCYGESKAGKWRVREWEVYIVNKVIREGFLRGCGRKTARWIFGRTAF